MKSVSRCAQRGLTLLELVVVLAILAILAAMVIPIADTYRELSHAATNVSVTAGVDRAVESYQTRTGRAPAIWDNLISSGGTLYSKLHPNLLSTTTPFLSSLSLDAGQIQSLLDAGITTLAVPSETSTDLPSNSATTTISVGSGVRVAALVKGTFNGYGSTFLDRAFNEVATATGEYVVLGIGPSSSLRGSEVHQSSVIQSTNPLLYYARVLCVYKVPPTGTTPGDARYFKANYLGAFMPDGTCANDSLSNYANATRQ